ncbi:unnamed protein product, partial [Discosporangium mesarthrocarpum]
GTGAGGCQLWVSHRLEGKGVLLQATLEQRASRARAPPPVPRFSAVGDMPWVGCRLEGVPPTLLQGEAVKATLRIHNRGRAPASDFYLKTNLPWVVFDLPRGGPDDPMGGAAGASGTVLRPPLNVLMPGGFSTPLAEE